MNYKQIEYRRNLPHIHPTNATFFITFRLAGSIPSHILNSLHEKRKKDIFSIAKKYSADNFHVEKYKFEKYYFGRFDEILDSSLVGPHWLQRDDIAEIVAEKIYDLDMKRYNLIAFTIMPNQVHILFSTSNFAFVSKSNLEGKSKKYPLADIMRLLKGSTARNCNSTLKRDGPFWQKESYDHFVRNLDELGNIIRYIQNNPVKCGLVKNWRDWKYTYYSLDTVEKLYSQHEC